MQIILKNIKKLIFLFGSVIKHKLIHGYKPHSLRFNIYWSFGFYTSHSIGFFIRKKSQMKVGLYKLQYRYSSDYDLFYRLIVKHEMKGMATKKMKYLENLEEVESLLNCQIMIF